MLSQCMCNCIVLHLQLLIVGKKILVMKQIINGCGANGYLKLRDNKQLHCSEICYKVIFIQYRKPSKATTNQHLPN